MCRGGCVETCIGCEVEVVLRTFVDVQERMVETCIGCAGKGGLRVLIV